MFRTEYIGVQKLPHKPSNVTETAQTDAAHSVEVSVSGLCKSEKTKQ